MVKIAVFGHNTPFWGILGLFGPSGPSRARGFTSTPRAGAPRYPAGGLLPLRAHPRERRVIPLCGVPGVSQSGSLRSVPRLLGKGQALNNWVSNSYKNVEQKKPPKSNFMSPTNSPSRPGRPGLPRERGVLLALLAGTAGPRREGLM